MKLKGTHKIVKRLITNAKNEKLPVYKFKPWQYRPVHSPIIYTTSNKPVEEIGMENLSRNGILMDSAIREEFVDTLQNIFISMRGKF